MENEPRSALVFVNSGIRVNGQSKSQNGPKIILKMIHPCITGTKLCLHSFP